MSSLLLEIHDAVLTLPPQEGEAAPHRALDHVRLILRRGEHTALLGPNGAGKSTLLRLMRGEAWPDMPGGGSIVWHTSEGPEDAPLAGRAMTALVSAAQHENYLRQGWDISGEDLLLTGFSDTPLIYTMPPAAQRGAVHELAERLRIVGLLSRPVNTLSQGQLRILLLGRALVRRPALLLLDECTDGLDAPTRRRVMDILHDAARDSTLVMTTHRADTLPPWLHRILHLRAGVLTESPARTPAFRANATPEAVPGCADRREVPSRPAPEAGLPLVDIRQATVYVERVPVLHNITWTIRPGEQWMISGGNGAGKSTLLRLLAGDEHPAAGGSIIRHLPRHGGRTTELATIRRGVRLVSDSAQALYGYELTGLELVLSGFDGSIGLYRNTSETEKEEALRWMRRFGVDALAERSIRRLSTGQVRRLFLARALVGTPDLLLLDEPCSGLDDETRNAYLALLNELAGDGVHLVLVSHHEEDRIPAINRTALLEDGHLTVLE